MLESEVKEISFDDIGIEVYSQKTETYLDKYNRELSQKLGKLLAYLDDYQSSIVDLDIDQPIRCIANAGSGKTMVLIARSLKMVVVDRIPAHHIVLITFTNKAAREIRERYIKFFEDILTPEELQDISVPQISTIHSFGYTIINKIFGIFRTISNEYQSQKLMKECLKEALGTKKVEHKTMLQVYDSYSAMVANCEVHFACLPRIDAHGNLTNVLERGSYGPFIKEQIDFFDQFAYSAMAKRIAGLHGPLSEEFKRSIVRDYSDRAGITDRQFVKALSTYYRHKYQTDVLDFSDMMFFPMLLIAFNKQMQPVIWDRYQYYSMDEAQDADGIQMALCFACDRDSYERFTKCDSN